MEETATETIDLALPSSFVKAVALNKDRILEGRMVAIRPGILLSWLCNLRGWYLCRFWYHQAT